MHQTRQYCCLQDSYHWRTGQAGQEVERGQSKTEKDMSEISVGLDRENRVHGRLVTVAKMYGVENALEPLDNNLEIFGFLKKELCAHILKKS